MITRRKIMGYLAGMLGAGITGAQASVSPSLFPDDIFNDWWKREGRRLELARSEKYQRIIELFTKLGNADPTEWRNGSGGVAFCITDEVYAELWNRSPAYMLLELPKPMYEHRVLIDTMTDNILVMRPHPTRGYWPFDKFKVLRS